MNIFSTFITKNLIDYLNEEDAYLQIESGVFQLVFQKKTESKLDWDKLQRLTSSLSEGSPTKYSNMNEYCKNIIEKSLLYEPLGLDITIRIDLMQVSEIEQIQIDSSKVFLLTPKLLQNFALDKTFRFTMKIVERDIDRIILNNKCSLEMLKNILLSLFSNNGKLLREQKQIQYSNIDPKLIIDNKMHLIDGVHRLVILYLLGAKKVRCVEVDAEYDHKVTPLTVPPKCSLDNIDALIDLEIFIRTNKINEEFIKFCKSVSPPCIIDKEVDLLKRRILAKWISKIPLEN